MQVFCRNKLVLLDLLLHLCYIKYKIIYKNKLNITCNIIALKMKNNSYDE